MLQLIHGARLRCLIGTPAQDARTVPEAITRHLIVQDFDNELWPQGDPLALTTVVPATGTAGSFTREARCFNQRLELRGKRRAVGRGDT